MTIPFDELAFMNGAVAITLFGEEEVRYLRDDESRKGFMVVKWEGCYFDQHLSRKFANSNLSMKPTTSEDGWLPVKGDGTIPKEIAGAKAGEWERKKRNGDTEVTASLPTDLGYLFNHSTPSEVDIVAVRLVRKEEKPKIEMNKKDLIDSINERCKANVKQVLNRQALSRFQSSPRGKEFRAQLGHVDTPPPAIGQDGIEGAIFAALCESMRREGR